MKYIKPAVSVAVIIGITLFMMETGLRILSIFPVDSRLYVNDENTGYRMRPYVQVGKETTNNMGFRDVDHSVYKKPGIHRLAFIGDSFVFGVVPGRDNFTSVFQSHAVEAGAAIEVLNMGVPAAGPENYLAILKNDAVKMSVDTVCVLLFIGNDITQAHPDFTTRVWLGTPRETLEKSYSIGLSSEYFYVFRMTVALKRMIMNRMDPSIHAISRKTYLSIQYQRSSIYKKKQSPFIKTGYERTAALLKEMAQTARRQNMEFFVVLAPDEIQVNQILRDEMIKAYSLNPDDYDFALPQRILVRQLTDSGIRVFDLLPFFIGNSSAGLYRKQDTHWNVKGNRLAGETIWQYFSERDNDLTPEGSRAFAGMSQFPEKLTD